MDLCHLRVWKIMRNEEEEKHFFVKILKRCEKPSGIRMHLTESFSYWIITIKLVVGIAQVISHFLSCLWTGQERRHSDMSNFSTWMMMLLTTVMMIVKQSHQMGFMNTMMMMLTRENTNIPGLGCFACRWSFEQGFIYHL